MGRSSQEQAARNRQAVVAAASRLIRQKGIDGVGVRELMGSAGLTQGAFGGQFGSKEALAAEACTFAFGAAEHTLAEASQEAFKGDGPGQAGRVVEYYLSPKPPGLECPMATLAMDSRRSPADGLVRQAFTDGLGRLARVVAGDPPSPGRLTLLAAMVGAAVLRGASNDQALTGEIEAAVLDFGRSME